MSFCDSQPPPQPRSVAEPGAVLAVTAPGDAWHPLPHRSGGMRGELSPPLPISLLSGGYLSPLICAGWPGRGWGGWGVQLGWLVGSRAASPGGGATRAAGRQGTLGNTGNTEWGTQGTLSAAGGIWGRCLGKYLGKGFWGKRFGMV